MWAREREKQYILGLWVDCVRVEQTAMRFVGRFWLLGLNGMVTVTQAERQHENRPPDRNMWSKQKQEKTKLFCIGIVCPIERMGNTENIAGLARFLAQLNRRSTTIAGFCAPIGNRCKIRQTSGAEPVFFGVTCVIALSVVRGEYRVDNYFMFCIILISHKINCWKKFSCFRKKGSYFIFSTL